LLQREEDVGQMRFFLSSRAHQKLRWPVVQKGNGSKIAPVSNGG